jgi:hypothetical protein
VRDPHVESLTYRLQVGETSQYVDPPRLEGATDEFSYVLENGVLVLHMKKHHASAAEAKAAAAGFLFVWELDAALRLGRPDIRFAYEDAQLIDRIPPPPGAVEIHMAAAAAIAFVGEVTFRVINSAYPKPPRGMKFTPDLETLWRRYEGYQARREPLSTMAYFCLTVLETSAGGRAEAARQYSIDPKVLGKIGDLTANRGDGATARKMQLNLVPYTPAEIGWVEEAIRIIIRRVGEIGGAACQTITMKDLPDL